MDETEMVQELGRFLEQLVAKDEFSGSVLVAKERHLLFKKGYGLANWDFNIPNHAETKFHLASLSKVFTSVAVAQLAEQGALSFHDPVSLYLTDYPRDIAEKVTIHHLLTHTSGMGDCFTEQFWSTPREHFRTVQDWLPLFSDLPLAFQPGERWSYSNAGFVVLGAVIERVSKQSYFDYLRDYIYKPAMMSNTDAYEMDQPVATRRCKFLNVNHMARRTPGL